MLPFQTRNLAILVERHGRREKFRRARRCSSIWLTRRNACRRRSPRRCNVLKGFRWQRRGDIWASNQKESIWKSARRWASRSTPTRSKPTRRSCATCWASTAWLSHPNEGRPARRRKATRRCKGRIARVRSHHGRGRQFQRGLLHWAAGEFRTGGDAGGGDGVFGLLCQERAFGDERGVGGIPRTVGGAVRDPAFVRRLEAILNSSYQILKCTCVGYR